MDKGYIVPDTAAKSFRQTVYIYGAARYSKTELVKKYLKNRRYRYASCEEDVPMPVCKNCRGMPMLSAIPP